MSNGPFCCYVRACCPEPEQHAALVKALAEHLQDDPAIAVVDAAEDLPSGTLKSIVSWLLERVDLVPRGVGAAIVEGYGPYFKAFKRAGSTVTAEAEHEE